MIVFAFNKSDDLSDLEPKTYEDAVSCSDSLRWIESMTKEMESLEKNKTWDLVPKPKGVEIVACNWLYKKKFVIADVEKPRFK